MKLIVVGISVFVALNASANLRDRIRERFLKKMVPEKTPEVSFDLSKKIIAPGTLAFGMKVSGHERTYLVHVPKSYEPSRPLPVLFVLHGGGGNMYVQANDDYYHQISQSEKLGFIAVFPNGYSKHPKGILATWNAGNCCAEARDQNIDDVTFFKEMVKALQGQLNVDSKRIYLTGMSNGAMMSYRLACEMSETFAAIAAVAGTDNTVNCSPKRPVSILHIHALDDEHVKFQGGIGEKAVAKKFITDFTSVPDTIKKWVRLNKCTGSPHRRALKNGAYCERYESCAEKSKIELCVTPTGGHSWPGGKKPKGGEAGSTDLSANDVMWEFFNL